MPTELFLMRAQRYWGHRSFSSAQNTPDIFRVVSIPVYRAEGKPSIGQAAANAMKKRNVGGAGRWHSISWQRPL